MADTVETIRMEVRFDEADMDRAAKAAEASINKGRGGGGRSSLASGGAVPSGPGGKGDEPGFSKRIAESFGQAFQSRIQGIFRKAFGSQAGEAAGAGISAKAGAGLTGAIGKLGAVGAVAGLVVAGFTQLLGTIKSVAQGLAEYNGGIAYALALMENTWDRIMFAFADALAPAVEAIAEIFEALEPVITEALKAFAKLLVAVASIIKIVVQFLVPVFQFIADILKYVAIGLEYFIAGLYTVAAKIAKLFLQFGKASEYEQKAEEHFADAVKLAAEVEEGKTEDDLRNSPPGWWSPGQGATGTPTLPGQAPSLPSQAPGLLPGQNATSPNVANPRPVYMPGPLATPVGPSLTVNANLQAQAAVQTAIEQARGFLMGQLDRMTDETRFLAMQITGGDIARML